MRVCVYLCEMIRVPVVSYWFLSYIWTLPNEDSTVSRVLLFWLLAWSPVGSSEDEEVCRQRFQCVARPVDVFLGICWNNYVLFEVSEPVSWIYDPQMACIYLRIVQGTATAVVLNLVARLICKIFMAFLESKLVSMCFLTENLCVILCLLFVLILMLISRTIAWLVWFSFLMVNSHLNLLKLICFYLLRYVSTTIVMSLSTRSVMLSLGHTFHSAQEPL